LHILAVVGLTVKCLCFKSITSMLVILSLLYDYLHFGMQYASAVSMIFLFVRSFDSKNVYVFRFFGATDSDAPPSHIFHLHTSATFRKQQKTLNKSVTTKQLNTEPTMMRTEANDEVC
jgi:hypothetical protein